MKTYEVIPKMVGVNNKKCMGCKRHARDIMITFSEEHKEGESSDGLRTKTLHDVFLTAEQAEQLIVDLEKSLDINSEIEERMCGEN